jgi:hypothetical protein
MCVPKLFKALIVVESLIQLSLYKPLMCSTHLSWRLSEFIRALLRLSLVRESHGHVRVHTAHVATHLEGFVVFHLHQAEALFLVDELVRTILLRLRLELTCGVRIQVDLDLDLRLYYLIRGHINLQLRRRLQQG